MSGADFGSWLLLPVPAMSDARPLSLQLWTPSPGPLDGEK